MNFDWFYIAYHKQKGFVSIILVVVIVAGAVLAGYFYFNKGLPSVFPPKPEQRVTPTPTIDPTANLKNYESKTLGIAFKYPRDWEISETDNSVNVIKDPDLRTVENACPGYSFSVSILTENQPKLLSRREIFKGEAAGVAESTNKYDCYIKTISVPSFLLVLTMRSKQKQPIVFDQILDSFKFLEEKMAEQKVFCTTPRPEVCTLECVANPPYICGSDRKSYCSACQACSNKQVEWHVTRQEPCGNQ